MTEIRQTRCRDGRERERGSHLSCSARYKIKQQRAVKFLDTRHRLVSWLNEARRQRISTIRARNRRRARKGGATTVNISEITAPTRVGSHITSKRRPDRATLEARRAHQRRLNASLAGPPTPQRQPGAIFTRPSALEYTFVHLKTKLKRAAGAFLGDYRPSTDDDR